jgi:hypothetical protein
MSSGCSTAVELLPYQPKFKGLSKYFMIVIAKVFFQICELLLCGSFDKLFMVVIYLHCSFASHGQPPPTGLLICGNAII